MDERMELIQKMKSRKFRLLHIGDNDIQALRHFMNGYWLCLQAHSLEYDGEFDQFMEFVSDALGARRIGYSIWELIEQKTASKEEAFEMFFSFVDEYCRKTGLTRA